MRHILFLALALLSSCSLATTAKFQETMNTWPGNHADQFIQSWGTPTKTTELESGNRLLEFARARTISIPNVSYTVPQMQTGNATVYGPNGTTYVRGTTYSPVQHNMGGVSTVEWCTIKLLVNHRWIIQSWTADGNACKL